MQSLQRDMWIKKNWRNSFCEIKFLIHEVGVAFEAYWRPAVSSYFSLINVLMWPINDLRGRIYKRHRNETIK